MRNEVDPTEEYYLSRVELDGAYVADPSDEEAFIEDVIDMMNKTIVQLRADLRKARVERHAGKWVA